MEKVKEKTTLKAAYEKLNSEEKKACIEAYQERFLQKTTRRFYQVLDQPQKLTAFEGAFFAMRLRLSISKIINNSPNPDTTQMNLVKGLNLSK